MAAQAKNSKVSKRDIEEYRGQLLGWYDKHRRDIPWRAKPGEKPNPYHVWLSEIMCQQTTVQAVKAYYLKFLDLWPTVHDLANADQEDVMAAWAGLGYYARARNLHKCAKIVANDLNGTFPDNQEDLKKLPGIGDYTAAAIAAIAFNKPATVVDGNVERVIARFFAVQDPLPNSKTQLKELAHHFFNDFEDRPGDLAQSFMDLGAGICIPKAPRCGLCPLHSSCEGYEQDIAAELPRKIKKADRPKKFGNLYWIKNSNGQILLDKRPEKGLLGGMLGLPTTEWLKEDTKLEHPEVFTGIEQQNMSVHHTFTHFDLELRLFEASAEQEIANQNQQFFWESPQIVGEKLPTVFKKGFKAFIEG